MFLSYKNQSIDLDSKLITWFLCYANMHRQWVKSKIALNKFTNFCLVELTFALFENDAAYEKRIHHCENSQTKQEENYISKLFTMFKPLGIKHEVYFTTGTII